VADPPANRLPPQARTYWRVSTLLSALLPLIVSLAVAPALPGALRWAVPLAVLVVAALAAAVVPELRWRRWRYEVREEELDLQHGTFVVRRTLVPIRRVQHVDTQAGPLQSTFQLAAVSFHTAAGATTIPALATYEAERVRDRVAALARARDDV